MDKISEKCAIKLSYYLKPLLKENNIKCKDGYVDIFMRWLFDAPNWQELRQCLYSLNPSDYILSQFEAIDDIDEYACKLVEYAKEHKNQL